MSEVRKTEVQSVVLRQNEPLDSAQKQESGINSVFRQNISKQIEAMHEAQQHSLSKIEESVPNDKVVDYYDKQLLKIKSEISKLDEVWSSIDESSFDELIKFMEEHNLNMEVYDNEKDVPKGALKFDCEPFGIGKLNEDETSFTGEICKKGYVKGLENLTPEERKVFGKKLKYALDNAKIIMNTQKKLDKLQTDEENHFALKDMASTGLIEKVGSKDFEREAINFWKTQRESNIHYQQIQQLKAQAEALRLKVGKTDADMAKIVQLNKKIEALSSVMETYSIKNVGDVHYDIEKGFSITPKEEESISQDNNQMTISSEHGVMATYGNENFDIMFGGTKGETYVIGSNYKFENKYSAIMNATYKFRDFAASASTTFNGDDNFMTLSQSAAVGYKGTNFEVNETVNFMKQEPEQGQSGGTKWGHSFQTDIALSHQIENYNLRESVTFAEEGTTYAVSGGAMYQFPLGKDRQSAITLNPSISNSFTAGEQKMDVLSPSFGIGINHSKGDLSLGLNISENYSMLIGNIGADKLDITHMNQFAVRGDLKYKQFSTSLSYMNNYAETLTQTIGVEFGLDFDKAGTLNVGYDHQFNGTGAEKSETGLYKISWAMKFDNIGKKK